MGEEILNLEGILAGLVVTGNPEETNARQLQFLARAYRPGNIAVADALLDRKSQLAPGIIKRELEWALAHGPAERAVTFAKKRIDLMVETKETYEVAKTIIGWGDRDVANYAIEQFKGLAKATNAPEFFVIISDIAAAFGRPQDAKVLLETALAHHINVHGKFNATVIDYYVRLQMPREAMEVYLGLPKSDAKTWNLYKMLALAEEHVPDRLREVAALGIEYGPAIGNLTYVRCAEILNRVDEAKHELRERVKRFTSNNYRGPRKDFVAALVRVGLPENAKDLVRRIAAITFADSDDFKELGDLFSAAGLPVEDIEIMHIDYHLSSIKQSSSCWSTDSALTQLINHAARVYEKTKDPRILDRRFQILEFAGLYDDAMHLATAQGDAGRQRLYAAMAHETNKALTPHHPIIF